MTGSALTQIRQHPKGSILTWYKSVWVRGSGHAGALFEAGELRCINLHWAWESKRLQVPGIFGLQAGEIIKDHIKHSDIKQQKNLLEEEELLFIKTPAVPWLQSSCLHAVPILPYMLSPSSSFTPWYASEATHLHSLLLCRECGPAYPNVGVLHCRGCWWDKICKVCCNKRPPTITQMSI